MRGLSSTTTQLYPSTTTKSKLRKLIASFLSIKPLLRFGIAPLSKNYKSIDDLKQSRNFE